MEVFPGNRKSVVHLHRDSFPTGSTSQEGIDPLGLSAQALKWIVSSGAFTGTIFLSWG